RWPSKCGSGTRVSGYGKPSPLFFRLQPMASTGGIRVMSRPVCSSGFLFAGKTSPRFEALHRFFAYLRENSRPRRANRQQDSLPVMLNGKTRQGRLHGTTANETTSELGRWRENDAKTNGCDQRGLRLRCGGKMLRFG